MAIIQCDQIGLFLKSLGSMFSIKSGPMFWRHFRVNLNTALTYLVKTVMGLLFSQLLSKNEVIRTKRSERAKLAHSVLREVEKMGYKKIFARTRIG